MIRKISWPKENLRVINNHLVTTSWVRPVPTECLNVFFNRKAESISTFAKYFDWKRRKQQFNRLFIQICSSLKSTYYLHALRWVTSVLLCLESKQIEEPNLFQSTGEQAVAKEYWHRLSQASVPFPPLWIFRNKLDKENLSGIIGAYKPGEKDHTESYAINQVGRDQAHPVQPTSVCETEVPIPVLK